MMMLSVSERIRLLRHAALIQNDRERKIWLGGLADRPRSIVVSFLNAHAFTLARKDSAFANQLFASDFLLRDGVGISILLQNLGFDPGLNMNGTDLIPEIIRVFKGRNIALCGTQEPWLSKASDVVKGMGGNVVLKMDGFQDHDSYIQALTQIHPALIIFAMGMPNQEALSIRLARELAQPAVIVNGGAILDFMAERFSRAPLFWRQLHLEWFFRLMCEPGRLARRYIMGGADFLFEVLYLTLVHRYKITAD